MRKNRHLILFPDNSKTVLIAPVPARQKVSSFLFLETSNKWILLILFFCSFFCKAQDSLLITEFNTHSGVLNEKDSIWSLSEKIHIPTLPTSLSITVKDYSDSLDLICIIQEDLKLYDTVQMGINPTVHFYNLSGGNYTATFTNRINKHQTQLKFEIETVFWEKWWFGPIMIFLISLVLGVVYYFIYIIKLRERLKNQKMLHELEMKALRAQMNPHFIFNSMNTIDAYVLNKRFVEASDYLQKFSKLIRNTLENSENETVSISKDLHSLQLYLELEQERFQNTFRFNIEADREVLDGDFQIPPLLIQPFVENAIIHGVRHLGHPGGTISITLRKVSGYNRLEVVVTDNGVGRKVAAEINQNRTADHKSMGILITMNRIKNFQELYGSKEETIIYDLPNGTEVHILFPLIKV